MHKPNRGLWPWSLALAVVFLVPSLSRTAQAADIKTGLKAYWNFDQKNFKDSVGIFDGTENGDSPITFVSGKSGFGQAIKLEGPSDSGGANQYVEITGGEPDDLAFQDGSMSLSLWFTVDAWDKSWQAVAAKGEGGNWRIHRRSGENVMAFTGGSAGDTPSGTTEVNDGQWHHLVAIKDADADAEYLWIDGVQDALRESEGPLAANGQRMMIGENPDARNRYWHGLVDDVAVWDRPLTEAEVASLWNNGAGKALSAFFAPPVDTDNDGMPDDYEVQMGFNPNDPSDAAQDFDKDGVSNLDEYKAGTDPIDTTKPTIVSVASTASFDTVNLTFSEDLDPATATVTANYTITPSLAVTAATYNRKVVTLTTAKQTSDGTAYTVAVKGVTDTSKNEVAAGTQATFYSYILTRTGVLKFSYWGDISGTAVTGLYDDLRYPDSPDMVGAVFSFNSRDIFPDDSHENYGATMEGYITPAESGDYRFFIYSDDASELYLSTDDKEDNLVFIAEETDCCDIFPEPEELNPQTSEPISLTAGKKYFIRHIYKEGGGGDYGQIAWRKEGDKTPAASLRPIPGQFLSSAVDLAVPAEGGFVTQTPGPDAKNVSPAVRVKIAHRDGKAEWTANNVSLKFDGQAVTPQITKAGNVLTIEYPLGTLLASESAHTIALGHPDPAGQPTTTEWSFTTLAYSGPDKDKVKGYSALLIGNANYTADAGGNTGKAGDYGMDLTARGSPVQVVDPSFMTALNAATAKDELSVSLWVKKYDIADSSAIWFSSPTQDRVFQAHTPWSNNNIYFDTAGCCDGGTQRINDDVANYPGYTGDIGWWTNNWHLFVFTKKADQKNIYIDGDLFLNGSNTGTLSTDINQFNIGADYTTSAGKMHAIVDDVAVYTKELSQANVTALKNGTKPSALPAAAGLLAYWDFNTIQVAAPTIGITAAAGNVRVTFTGTLQSASSITGPWTDVAGAASPATVPTTATQTFYRSKQ